MKNLFILVLITLVSCAPMTEEEVKARERRWEEHQERQAEARRRIWEESTYDITHIYIRHNFMDEYLVKFKTPSGKTKQIPSGLKSLRFSNSNRDLYNWRTHSFYLSDSTMHAVMSQI